MEIKKGVYIKERYIKCPYPKRKCEWMLGSKMRNGYGYLESSCYLSGSFELRCPEKGEK